jgi:DNA-binding transcriptional ArsR family regulator
MEQSQALLAFGALAQGTRLHLFQMLVARGSDGLSAGIIAERLGVAPSSLSFHLQQLVRSGLVAQRRVGRQLIYSAEPGAIEALLVFLSAHCRAASIA